MISLFSATKELDREIISFSNARIAAKNALGAYS